MGVTVQIVIRFVCLNLVLLAPFQKLQEYCESVCSLVLQTKVHKTEKTSDSYKAPTINLSNIELILEESAQLNLGLEYNFVDKKKY